MVKLLSITTTVFYHSGYFMRFPVFYLEVKCGKGDELTIISLKNFPIGMPDKRGWVKLKIKTPNPKMDQVWVLQFIILLLLL